MIVLFALISLFYAFCISQLFIHFVHTHFFMCCLFPLSCFTDSEDLYTNISSMCEFHYILTHTAKRSEKLFMKNVLSIYVVVKSSSIWTYQSTLTLSEKLFHSFESFCRNFPNTNTNAKRENFAECKMQRKSTQNIFLFSRRENFLFFLFE